MTLEEANAYFAGDTYAVGTTGIEILQVGEHYAKCRLRLDGRHLNAAGKVMGGVAYTLADFVFAVATNSGREILTVTTVSTISYLNPCTSEYMIGESELLKEGKRQCFYRINITDENGTLLAVVNTTGTHIEPKEPKKEN